MASVSRSGTREPRATLVWILVTGLFALCRLATAASAGPPLQTLPDRRIELPGMTCEALLSREFAPTQQVTFRIVSAAVQPATPDRAEFCLVKGYVAPQVQFALYLPTRGYTGRYLQGGCGGMCGVVGESLTPACDNLTAFKGSFALGFNNSGHIGAGIGDATWATEAPELRKDYAYRATHVAQIAAKAVVTAFYGKPPRWSYFQGCSDGGREALMESQRYPEDFNGIVAGSVFSMPAVMEQFLWDAHVALTADGQMILTPQATALLHRAVLEKCDALDGARDGQIDDPRLCHYDPGKLACRKGLSGSACLTAEQVTAARLLYRGPMDDAGQRLFPGGLPYGSELLWSAPGALTATGVAAGGFLRNLAFPKQLPPEFTWRDWRFDLQSFQKLEAAAAVYDPSSPDLKAFREAGGKLILWQGTADQASGIYGMPEYYQSVRDTMGGLEATRQFARLFLIPGVYHCGGGYVPYQEDFLGAVVNWVEARQAPTQIVASAPLPDGKVRERPLFAYPERAKYTRGDFNEVHSFVGIMPGKEPDDHYDWAGAAARSADAGVPAASAPTPDIDTGAGSAGQARPHRMTREMFAEYIRRFNRRDERYAGLYRDDVVFEHGAYYGTLRGPQAILDFYRQTWKSFAQTLVPGDVVIDNDRGLMAVEMTTHLVARVGGVASQSHPQGMKVGDEIVSMGVVFYEIKDGQITHIRGAAQKSVFHPVGSRTVQAPLPESIESLTPEIRAQVETSYGKYIACFNAHDVSCFGNFYDDEVVFMAAPQPGMIGREAVVRFYEGVWQHLREHLTVRAIAFKNGGLKVSLQNTIDVLEDYPDFPVRPLKKGEHYTKEGTINYQLHAGRFIRISDGTR